MSKIFKTDQIHETLRWSFMFENKTSFLHVSLVGEINGSFSDLHKIRIFFDSLEMKTKLWSTGCALMRGRRRKERRKKKSVWWSFVPAFTPIFGVVESRRAGELAWLFTITYKWTNSSALFFSTAVRQLRRDWPLERPSATKIQEFPFAMACLTLASVQVWILGNQRWTTEEAASTVPVDRR